MADDIDKDDELRPILDAAKRLPTDIDTDASWAQMRERLSSASRRRLQLSQSTSRPPRRRWIPVAAAAALLVAASLARFVGRPSGDRAYATAAGERMDVALNDGTRVTLAPGSRLTVDANYGRTSRDVALQGEAYVIVVHDPAHPFHIRVDSTSLTDVGTTFDVRAYSDEHDWSVVVADGAVDLAHAGQDVPARLRHGDLAVVSGRAITIAHDVDVAARIGWVDGRLVFAAQPLVSVLGELSRWYGATIRLTDTSLANVPIRAAYQHAALPTVLNDLGARYGLTWTQSGNAVVISPRTAEHHS